MKVTKENFWEVLQRIYDSEIDLALARLWDWWLTYAIENKVDPLESWYKDAQWTWCTDLSEWLQYAVNYIIEKFPHSTFVKRWNSQD